MAEDVCWEPESRKYKKALGKAAFLVMGYEDRTSTVFEKEHATAK